MSRSSLPLPNVLLRDLPSLQPRALPPTLLDRLWSAWISPTSVLLVSSVVLGAFFLQTTASMKIGSLPWPSSWLWSPAATSLRWGIWGFLLLAVAMDKAATLQKGFFLFSHPYAALHTIPLDALSPSADRDTLESHVEGRFSSVEWYDGTYLIAERGRTSAMGQVWVAICLPLALLVALLASWWGHKHPLHLGLLFALPWAILGLFLQTDQPHERLVLWRQGSQLHLLGIAPYSPASLHQTILALQAHLLGGASSLEGSASKPRVSDTNVLLTRDSA